MHKIGDVLGFIFNKIFIVILLVVLMVGVPLIGITGTFTDREAVKSILAEADVYNTVPENILDIIEIEEPELVVEGFEQQELDVQTQVRTVRDALEENGLIDPDELIATVKRTLDAGFLQGQVEGVIDGVYSYLDGSSSSFEFELTLRDRVDVVSNELRSFISSSLESIPECGPNDIKDGDDIDILDIDCLPPGSMLADEIDSFIDELAETDGVLGQVYTQEDLDLSEVDLEGARIAYSAMSSFALLFWLATIGVAMAVVLTSHSTHRGFKIVGGMLAFIGTAFIIGFSVITNATDFSDIAIEDSDLSATQEQALLNVLEPVAEQLAAQLNSQVLFTSLALVILGIGSFVLGIYLTKHHVEHVAFHQHHDEQEPVYPEPTKGVSKPAPALANSDKPKPEAKKPAPKKPAKKTTKKSK